MEIKTVAVIAVMVVLVSACVGQTNPYQAEIGGQKITFRANLDKARDVPVYPDADALKSLLLSHDVGKISIAYLPENESNGFYTVTGYELSYKMIAIQNAVFGDFPKVEGLSLNNTDEAYGMASTIAPVILMKAGSDRTAVTVDGDVVIVEGKDMTEVGRDYTDLDLAADKLLLVLLAV